MHEAIFDVFHWCSLFPISKITQSVYARGTTECGLQTK